MNSHFDNNTRAGTFGGTLLSILLQIKSADVLRTAVLGVVGAVVSFSVSMALRWLVKQSRK